MKHHYNAGKSIYHGSSGVWYNTKITTVLKRKENNQSGDDFFIKLEKGLVELLLYYRCAIH